MNSRQLKKDSIKEFLFKKISNLLEIEHLVNLNILRDLNLHNNAVREVEDYRLAVIFKIPKLTMLDRRKIDPTDKVNAQNLFHLNLVTLKLKKISDKYLGKGLL